MGWYKSQKNQPMKTICLLSAFLLAQAIFDGANQWAGVFGLIFTISWCFIEFGKKKTKN